MTIPTEPPHYHLLAPENPRIDYGVDYSAYMATLARDLGGSPQLLALWRTHGLKVSFAYCFGASFVSFYRLLGPFRSAEAPEVAKVELMRTIKRRGVAGNLFFGLIPMVFYGLVNGLAMLFEALGLIPQELGVLEGGMAQA